MRTYLVIGVFLFLFITGPISNYLGLSMAGIASLSVLTILSFKKLNRILFSNNINTIKAEVIIIIIGFVIVLMKYAINDIKGLRHVFFFLFIPMLYSILFKFQGIKTQMVVRRLLLVFYVIECVIAIFEKAFLINFFPFTNELSDFSEYQNLENYEFRSTSLLGHPLMNALIVSVILAYILISNLKLKHKLFYLFLGLFALLSFNARGGIIIWLFITIIYIFRIIFYSKRKSLLPFIILFVAFVLINFIDELIINYGFGGRLLNNKLFDSSALTRIEVLKSFSYLNKFDFLFGNSNNYVPIMQKLGAAGVENSFIVIVINYGFIIALLLFIAYYFWISETLKHLNKGNKLLIIVAFILMGTTNNSLASYTPWVFFVLCSNTFKEASDLVIVTKSIN